MNAGKLRILPLSRHYARGIITRGYRPGALSPSTRRSISTCLLRRPVGIPYSKQPTSSSVVFRRHYAIEEEKVEGVSSIEDVKEVDETLQQMISEGSNIAETITRQNEDIKVGSELMIHAVYDSLVDLSLQLVIKRYPGGVKGLIDSEDAYGSFPSGMKDYIDEVRNGLKSNGPSNVHESSLEDAVERSTKLFKLVENAHSDLGQFFGEHHETINEKVQNMRSILKRAEKANTFINTETKNEETSATSENSTMTKEQTELEALESKIATLVDETRNWKDERRDLEKPQNVGEGIAWGFLGIGAAIAAGQRAKLSGSISSNESKLVHERALHEDHKTRYDAAFARLEKVNVTLDNLKSQKTSVNKHIKSLQKLVESSAKTLEFVVDRQNTLRQIHNDLVNMTNFATSYRTHKYDQQASLEFLARGVVDVLDVTPDWPGTTVPILIAVMFLRWPPSIVLSTEEDVLGEGGGADEQTEFKLHRVVEKASKNYMEFARVTSPRPRLNDYLHDVEFDWENTFYKWNKLIKDGEFTGFRPAPVVPQWGNY